MEKNISYGGKNRRKIEVALLISDKIDFQTKSVTRDKQEHYLMKENPYQDDKTIINVYAPKTETLNKRNKN